MYYYAGGQKKKISKKCPGLTLKVLMLDDDVIFETISNVSAQ